MSATETPQPPSLKTTVVALIEEFRDKAKLLRSEDKNAAAQVYDDCAERMLEEFVAFGKSLPMTTANTARAHATRPAHTGFIGVSMHDELGIASLAITVYLNAPGSPVTKGDPEAVANCARTLIPALERIINRSTGSES